MRVRHGLIAAAIAALILTSGAGAGSASAPPLEHPQLPKQLKPVPAKNPALDSRLAAVDSRARAAGEGPALETARLDGLTVKSGGVRVVVTSRSPGDAISAIQLAGGTVEATYGDSTQALVPPGRLADVAAGDGIRFVRPPLLAVPEVVDEGVAATNATAWQALGHTGAGVKVGIIDMGFSGYAAAQASGDLPPSVTTMDFCSGDLATATQHGTGVAEIVHQMAPDAQLYLICFDTEVTLGEAEQYAKAQGITVVNHSVGWFNSSRGDGSGGPGTPDAIVADATQSGIVWVNSAGNYAQQHWSGKFVDSNGDGWMDFTAYDEGESFWLAAGDDVCATLKWDSWPTTSQDFDLYLFDSATGSLRASSTNLQNGTQEPTEDLCYTNTTGASQWFFIAINRYAATASPRFDLFMLYSPQQLQYQVAAGSVAEPATSPDAFAVGAIGVTGRSIEPFSSRGPTIDNRIKPDLSGPDGVSTAAYAPYKFFGTSAAAPHVTGAAALVEGVHPDWSVAQVEAYLAGSATDLGTRGNDNTFGAGYLHLPVSAPHVTSFTPAAGPVGSVVTLKGTGLAAVGAVDFAGAVSAVPTATTATSVSAIVPVGAVTGPIQVVAPDGSSVSTASFKVTPKITGFTPTSAARMASIEVDGYNFTGATKVAFGAVPAAFGSVTPTSLLATVPATAVSGKITVTTAAGAGTSAAAFVVELPPKVASFTPASGPVGTLVTVNGSSLDSVTQATLDGDDVGALTHVSATQLKFTIPVDRHTGRIRVTGAAGSGQSTASFKVSPKITGFGVGPFRATRGLRGDPVEIDGFNFTGVTKVTVGGVAAAFTPVSDYVVDVTIPPTASTGKISVTTPDGSGTSDSSLVVTLPPTVTSFAPVSGPVGTVVTVNGTHLDSVETVTLAGDDVGAVTHVSAAQIRFTVPTPAHTGVIAATNDAGTKASTAQFKLTPKITGFSPASAARGASVEIDGYNFAGATRVAFGSVGASFSSVTDTSLVATVPATAVTNKVTVTTPAGSGTSAAAFTVVLSPTLTSFAPLSGAVGTRVTVTGTNLASVTSVSIGGVDAGPVTIVSATQLTFAVPSSADSGAIAVTNAAGTVTSQASFEVTLKLMSFTPTWGPVGTMVTITGVFLDPSLAVKFGDSEAEIYARGPTLLQVYVPTGAPSGPITVSNGSVAVTTGSAFAVKLPVAVDLGTLSSFGCWQADTAQGINDDGVITGVSCRTVQAAGGYYTDAHAFLWRNGTIFDLFNGIVGGSMGNAINSLGQVAGMTGGQADGTAGGDAFLYSGGAIQDLASALGATASAAYDINDSGVMVGYRVSGGSYTAFRYDTTTGSVTTLPGIGSPAQVSARAINDAGEVTGTQSGSRGLLWVDGVPQDIGTLGGTSAYPEDINADGVVVGESTRSDATYHAFLYDGTMHDLGVLGGTYSCAYAINDSGDVVGTSDGHAFLYHDGTMTDLNAWLPSGSGWTLAEARSINNLGQIVGTGTHNGVHRAFLLNPPSLTQP